MATEDEKRRALLAIVLADADDQMALLTERDTPERVEAWLRRCTRLDDMKAAAVAPALYEALRDLSGETYAAYMGATQ